MTTPAPPLSGRLRIRRAERADLLAVHRIEQASFPQPWPFSAFEQYLGEPGFLVADDGSVVGYVVADVVQSAGRQLGHIKDLAVHERRRGEGIGSSLLDGVLDVLDAQGAVAVKLEVRETNEYAIDLYRSRGFEHRRTVREYYSDGEDALVFVRVL